MPEKNRGETRRYHLWLFAIFFVLTNGGCQGNRTPVQSQTPHQPIIKKVVVVGFRAAISKGEKPDLVRNPITGTTFMSQPVSHDVVNWLTGQLFDRLVADKRWNLISPGQAKGIFESILGSDTKVAISPLRMLQKIGKSFGSDAVLIGEVYRWRERVGSDFGVESPASVAFDLSLVRPSDGVILWRGNYDKTQKSLFEDLFDFKTYIKSDGLWLTARKLAEFGLDKLLKDMPGSPLTEKKVKD